MARQIEQCEREGEKEEVDPHGMLGSIGSPVARVLGWKVSRGLILILKLIWIRMIMIIWLVGVCRNSFFWNFFAIWRFLRFQILSRFVPDLEFTDIFPEF